MVSVCFAMAMVCELCMRERQNERGHHSSAAAEPQLKTRRCAVGALRSDPQRHRRAAVRSPPGRPAEKAFRGASAWAQRLGEHLSCWMIAAARRFGGWGAPPRRRCPPRAPRRPSARRLLAVHWRSALRRPVRGDLALQTTWTLHKLRATLQLDAQRRCVLLCRPRSAATLPQDGGRGAGRGLDHHTTNNSTTNTQKHAQHRH